MHVILKVLNGRYTGRVRNNKYLFTIKWDQTCGCMLTTKSSAKGCNATIDSIPNITVSQSVAFVIKGSATVLITTSLWQLFVVPSNMPYTYVCAPFTALYDP